MLRSALGIGRFTTLALATLEEWPFRLKEGRPLAGDIADIFGDGSVFAISAPGHTPGSTAYVLRTPKGPVAFRCTGRVSRDSRRSDSRALCSKPRGVLVGTDTRTGADPHGYSTFVGLFG